MGYHHPQPPLIVPVSTQQAWNSIPQSDIRYLLKSCEGIFTGLDAAHQLIVYLFRGSGLKAGYGVGRCCDEAHFWLNGYVNKQNCRIWSEANPQVYVEIPLHPEKLTELWFQQDGATYHTARATIDLLKDTFGDRLISRSGPVNWPPRSCDLTPLDYFLWSYVKSLVYADKPQTLDHLEDNIRRVIADIRPQMLEKVIENWTSRLDYIRASRGSPMPEIIFKMSRVLDSFPVIRQFPRSKSHAGHSGHVLHGCTLNCRRNGSRLVSLGEEKERWEVPDHPQGVLPQNWGETEQHRTVTSMVLKAKVNDRRKNLAFSHVEFCGP
ncbi:DUF4817 domain-containing protein [Trichonephila clavipes]|nr:DUF4817 domain-containing protein [Trichonephila clavipes]